MVKEIRIFRCSCNHRLRYGASSCSYCFRPTPIWNRWWLPLVLVAVIGAGIWLNRLCPALGGILPDTRLQLVRVPV